VETAKSGAAPAETKTKASAAPVATANADPAEAAQSGAPPAEAAKDNAAKGVFTEVQTVSSLPEYFDGQNTGAEIDVHPSGKYLYVSNRGNDSVTLFEIDRQNGTLTYIEEQSTGGKTPRHFGLDPAGDHLAIANQTSNTLLLCRIDGGNGRLKPSGVFTDVPTPSCIVFLPPEKAGQRD
jgi:6-phosphogluconolactonase